MSRIGKMPIPLPEGTKVEIGDEVIKVIKGDASLEEKLHEGIHVVVEDQQILVTRENDSRALRSLHGLTRSLINNMVHGLNHGFFKNLEIVGVGYRVESQGNLVTFTLGYSHPIVFAVPQELKVTTAMEKGQPPLVRLEGSDKELIGQVCAKIRSFRKPEPYKGKGIMFKGEILRRKAGKTAGGKK